MRRPNVAMMVAAVFVLQSALSGCASLMGGPSDEELIADTLAAWKAATEAENVDGMMSCISDDFQTDEGGKAEVREYLSGVIDQGMLSGAEMDLTEAETTIEEDGTASVMGIELSGDVGSVVMDLEMKKDADGTWRIIGMDAY